MNGKLVQIHENAAGIDIGSSQIFLSVAQGEVKVYDSFTGELEKMVRYMVRKNVKTVAIEATGVLWMPLYDLLESAGIEVYLVNGREAKQMPGRKSDIKDCQWLAQLHSYGLLKRGFVPPQTIRQLRSYVRLRDDHIQMGATHINHMQKALELMNLKLHNVISQLTGKSGMKILKAIVAGQRDAVVLTKLCNKQILNKKRALVESSLQGNYKEEYIFQLKQAIAGWEFYQQQMLECDIEIENILSSITSNIPVIEVTEEEKPKQIRHNAPAIELGHLHQMLMQLTGGVNPTHLSGLTDLSLLKLIGETGTDMTKWATEKHFVSWCLLSPATDTSGKSRRKKRKRGNHRVGQIFRQAAQSLARSKYCALGSFYRRIRSRRGPRIAIKATARKLAVLFYRMMKYGIDYVEIGVEEYEKRNQEQQIKFLKKRAKQLNIQLVDFEGVVI